MASIQKESQETNIKVYYVFSISFIVYDLLYVFGCLNSLNHPVYDLYVYVYVFGDH